jgi:hypothetical protein
MEAMAQRHELGMDSYDRLFPSQDTMPRGGFGNLIALPLQHGPRQDGNSVFLDDHLVAIPMIYRYASPSGNIKPAPAAHWHRSSAIARDRPGTFADNR